MPKQLQLTWFAPRNCWKKFRKGKMYYLGKGKCRSKSDMSGYAAALAEWRVISGEAVKGEQREAALAFFETDPEIQRLIGLRATRQTYYEQDIANAPSFEQWEQAEAAKALAEKAKEVTPVEIEKTVAAHAEEFLKFKMGQTKAGMKSAGRLRNIRTYLNRFIAWMGEDALMETVDASRLAAYHAHLLNCIGDGSMTDYSARDALQILRQFIRRAASLGSIPLPNNIESKDLEIQISQRQIEPWQFDELKAALAVAPEPLRLYMLLAANCGMTQKDIADIKNAEVNWTDGIISRKRSKTQKAVNVPIVSYRLWPLTFELLRKHRATDSILALTASDGSPLVSDQISAAGKGSKRDNISKEFNEWSKGQGKGFAAIRKTSASKLAEHHTYARFAEHFLSHAPRGIGEKFYIRPSDKQFDKAVAWLGKQYGM